MPCVIAYRALLLLVVAGLGGCVTGCNNDKDGSPAASAQKTGTPTAFAPRSHQLIEKVETRGTPLRAVAPTAVAETDQPPSERLWVTASADPDEGGAPLTVNFTAEVEGPPGLRYRWDFGDHSPAGHQLSVQHTYHSPGEYTATLTVSGPDGEQADEVYVQVNEEGFDVSVDADPDIGPAPLTVHFSAVLDEDVSGPFYYQWDFGDGGRDVTNPTTHTYRFPGEYTATLVVTNPQAQSAHADVEIQVDPLEDDLGGQ